MPEDKKVTERSERSNVEIVESTTIADVYRAAKQLEGVARKTRLIHSDFFSEQCHNDVYLKPENLQHTGAFKLRGAYNKISQLTPEERAKGVITASAGNHAQGVAYAAQKLGVKAVICMPATTPILKVEGTRALGAEVVLHGDGFMMPTRTASNSRRSTATSTSIRSMTCRSCSARARRRSRSSTRSRTSTRSSARLAAAASLRASRLRRSSSIRTSRSSASSRRTRPA